MHKQSAIIAGVIHVDSVEEMRHMAAMPAAYFNVLELRLDALRGCALEQFQLPASPLPLLLTLRSTEQGGMFAEGAQAYWQALQHLARLQPAFLDVEYTATTEQIQTLQAIAPRTQIILSYHNFTETPAHLPPILKAMQQVAPNALYKIATWAHSTVDALLMLVFCKESPAPIIGICMGEAGQTTRILGGIVNTGFAYCPAKGTPVLGQISAQDLCEVYQFPSLNAATEIFGLLGDPVTHSQGHIFHNDFFATHKKNAVYVKWQVGKELLPQVMPLLEALQVQGLSITTPLKEAIVPYAHCITESVKNLGACNTLCRNNNQWVAHATDGIGAIHALDENIQGKRIVILGAGGAARAIVQALHQAKAQQILVFNRSAGKVAALGATEYTLQNMEILATYPYDIIINTLPLHIELPPIPWRAEATALEITYSGNSVFLEQAQKAGCRCVTGLAMFYAQAQAQQKLFSGTIAQAAQVVAEPPTT